VRSSPPVDIARSRSRSPARLTTEPVTATGTLRKLPQLQTTAAASDWAAAPASRSCHRLPSSRRSSRVMALLPPRGSSG
jgi:hypothetical protein